MSVIPIITFKAGLCELEDSAQSPFKVTPNERKGYIYLYSDDGLMHFCWRERSAPPDSPELELIMVPTDGQFVPYDTRAPSNPTAKTGGRIFVLKFTSSSQRYLFWLQSKPQARSGDPSWFSPRDLKIGDIVNRLLQGDEEINVAQELAQVQNNNDDRRDDGDDDQAMEDAGGDSTDHHQGGSGGAGADATGGDIREEGEGSREGGADGARAASSSAPDAAAAVRNFLASLQGQQGLSGGGQQQAQGKLYPVLNDLLDPPTTIPMIDAASDDYLDDLLAFLPPAAIVLSQCGGDGGNSDPSAEAASAVREAMTTDQKRSLLRKVLRSPQFTQSLASLTVALRDGGLPTIAEALGVNVENGGVVRGGSVPLGGGEAVEAFVEGVKKTVQKK